MPISIDHPRRKTTALENMYSILCNYGMYVRDYHGFIDEIIFRVMGPL